MTRQLSEHLRHRRPARRGFTLRELFYWTTMAALILAIVVVLFDRVRRRHVLTDLAVSADGQRVAASYSNGSTAVWEIASGRLIARLPAMIRRSTGAPLALSRDGRWLVRLVSDWSISAARNRLELWQVDSAARLYDAPSAYVARLSFSPDDRHVAACIDGGIVPIQLYTFSPRFASGDEGPLAPGDDTAGPAGGEVLVREEMSPPEASFQTPEGIESLEFGAFLPGEAQFVALEGHSGIGVYDIRGQRLRRSAPRAEIPASVWWLSIAAASPDGKRLIAFQINAAVPSYDVIAFDTENLAVVQHGVLDASGVEGAAFADSGRTLVLSRHGGLELWDPDSLQYRSTVGHEWAITGLAGTPDGRTVVASDSLNVYRLAAGQLQLAVDNRRSDLPFWGLLGAVWALTVAGVAAGVRRARKTCAGCGREFTDARASAVRCLACRQAMRSTSELATDRRTSRRRLLIVLGAAAAVATALIALVGQSELATGLLSLIGVLVGLWAVSVLAIVAIHLAVRLALGYWLADEARDFLAAERAAERPGCVERRGVPTIWTDGPPEVADQIESAWAHCCDRVPQQCQVRPAAQPLRVLHFQQRLALARYVRRHGYPLGDFSGLYLARPTAKLAFAAERLPQQHLDLAEQERRSLLALHVVQIALSRAAPPWFRIGTVNYLSQDEATADRLGRRLRAWLAAGNLLTTAQLVALRARHLRPLGGAIVPPEAYYRYLRVQAQSWAIVDYLLGPEAPAPARDELARRLHRRRTLRRLNDTLSELYGEPLDVLAERAYARIAARPPAMPPVVPPEQLQAIFERLIPELLDRTAPVQHRLRLLRNWGVAGIVAGIPLPVALLADPWPDVRQEAEWTLQMLSGHAGGPQPADWQSWLAGLPPEAVELPAGLAVSGPAGEG